MHTRVATRPEQVDEWTQIVIKAGEALLSFKGDSWQNGVNRNVDGRTVRCVLGYNGNGAHFRRTTDEVAKGGYREFAFRLGSANQITTGPPPERAATTRMRRKRSPPL